MRRLPSLFAGLLCLALNSSLASADGYILIRNQSTHSITAVRTKTAVGDSWGENGIKQPIAPGNALKDVFQGSSCPYTFKVEDAQGYYQLYPKVVDPCKEEVTWNLSDTSYLPPLPPSAYTKSGNALFGTTQVSTLIDSKAQVYTFTTACGTQSLTADELEAGQSPSNILPCNPALVIPSYRPSPFR